MSNELLMLIVGCVTFVIIVLIVCICMLISENWANKKVNISRDELRRLQDQYDKMYTELKKSVSEIDRDLATLEDKVREMT